MGKMAGGIADNLLTATYLAAKCPVFFAPAMDVDMFKHPSTEQNIRHLQSFGNLFIEPEEGELASGLYGAGRMQEPEKMVTVLNSYFRKKKDFKGTRVLITAGPTYESIDPVRFIGNRSSGKMGFALAEEFAMRGATVHLITGPVSLEKHHPEISVTRITTASELHYACMSALAKSDIIIMAAAVADYTPAFKEKKKIKKESSNLNLNLIKTTDILKELGQKKKKNQLLVGFALETGNELVNAQAKLKNKNLDLIVLNSLRDKNAGFEKDTNKITLIDKKGNVETYNLKFKTEVAIDIADYIKSLYSDAKKYMK
jgi:phosphopantothenoylcysteine decarboxylase/phosphopantothenate--cysteine ligase